jgi:hypothetical protein
LIFLKGIKIIFHSIRVKLLRRIEYLRFLFWENNSTFSRFNINTRISKKEIVFFEIYNYLINLNDWEIGINLFFFRDFYLCSNLKKASSQIFNSKNTRLIETENYQYVTKKYSLAFFRRN